MPAAPDPIEPTEFVLRRIHRLHCDLDLPVPILLAAFRPNKMDTTGISVFRQRVVSASAVAAAGRSPNDYFVAQLEVSELTALGLSVVFDEPPPGHLRIPEITFEMYERDKIRWKPVLQELACLASARIIRNPAGI
jgi:hypothetical protein